MGFLGKKKWIRVGVLGKKAGQGWVFGKFGMVSRSWRWVLVRKWVRKSGVGSGKKAECRGWVPVAEEDGGSEVTPRTTRGRRV